MQVFPKILKMNIGMLLLGFLFSNCDKENSPEDQLPPPSPGLLPKTNLAVSIIGDSISTGVLAQTQLGQLSNFEILEKALAFLIKNGTQQAPEKSLYREDIAAATSTKPYSLRTAIAVREGVDPSSIPYYSAAQFGAKTSDIDTMLIKLQEIYYRDRAGIPPKYVYIMLGGNDFCADRSVDDFRKSFEHLLSRTWETHQESKFIIAYLPPVDQITNFNYEYAIEFPNLGRKIFASCRSFQMKSCPPALREDAKEKVEQYNDVITQTAKQYQDRSEIFLLTSMQTWKLVENQLAFDCFHPSSLGQEKIGKFINTNLN